MTLDSLSFGAQRGISLSVELEGKAVATIGQTLTGTRPARLRTMMRKEGGLKLRGEVLLALDTLKKNPLRSALTILGIVIGITTVITVTAMINGLNDNVLAGIRELGSDTITACRWSSAVTTRRGFFSTSRPRTVSERKSPSTANCSPSLARPKNASREFPEARTRKTTSP